MKAIQCYTFGPIDQLRYEEVEAPGKPADDHLIISVKSAGVNFPDLLIVEGKYQFQPGFPFSPGGEVAGIVKEVGSGVDHFKPGDRVFAVVAWGGFAEEVVVPASNVFLLPESLDFDTGAVLAEAYGTSYHALVDRAQLKKGETLLVLGAAGGVGIAAVQIGRALGARVIAAAGTDEKLAFCQAHGADEVVNYSTTNLKDRMKEITGGRGVNVIYDPIGGPQTELALRTMAWGGRHLVVGFAAGDIPKIPLNLPLLKGCSLVGVFWGAFFQYQPEQNRENFKHLVNMVTGGQLKPPIHGRFSLENAVKAMQEIADRKVMGKVVLNVT